MKTQWIRVSKREPCTICGTFGHACTFSPALRIAWCLKVPSDRPSKNLLGGWIHRLGDPVSAYVPPPKPKPVAVVDCDALLKRWAISTSPEHVKEFAASLGVSALALGWLGTVWNNERSCWAFPMRDGAQRVTGIQLRYADGQKRAVTGTHAGCFIPQIPEWRDIDGCLYVCEGASDCAALLTMGVPAIGRFSALGTIDYTLDFVARKRFRRVVIVSDGDDVGYAGAEKLQAALTIPSCIFIPPYKDAREFARNGGDAEIMRQTVKDLIWHNPKKDKL